MQSIVSILVNGPFSSCLQALFQSEARCKTVYIKMSFHLLANKTHFHFKGFVLDLVLKQRQKATRKWNISQQFRTLTLFYHDFDRYVG